MTEATRTLLGVLSDAARISLIYIVMILLMLIMLAHWGLPFFSVLKPQLVLMVVFYWTLFRPTLLPPWLVFVVGLILDGLNPVMPMGTHAFSYLLLAGLLRPRRRMLMGQPFMVVWLVFMIAVTVDLIIKSISLGLLGSISVPIWAMIINGLTTILLFPIIVMILVWIHRLLPATRGLMGG